MPLILLFLLVIVPGVFGTPSGEQPKEKGMIDRIMQFYSWNDPKAPKMAFQGKQFLTKGEFTDKKFAAGEYAGVKDYGSKGFATKSYSDSGKSWFGKLFPSKKIPENLQGGNPDAKKKFKTERFRNKDFDSASKVSPYAGKSAFATKEVSEEIACGKIHAGGDHHLKELLIQEGLKKGIYKQEGFIKDLSVDDVKRLLNKPGSPSE